MNKIEVYLEDNSFINYCYLNAIFFDFIFNSKIILNEMSSEENNELKEKFMKSNKGNKDKYFKKKLLIINQNEEGKKEKISLIKSNIELDLNDIEEKEDEIMKAINNKIISKIRQMASANNNKLNTMISDIYYDYLIESFSLFYNIIKLMKKNEGKKIGNLSQKYLFEEEDMKKTMDLNIKNLKKQISSLKNEIRKNDNENSKKIEETNKKYEDLMKIFIENEKKLTESIEKLNQVISENNEIISKNKELISENNELISENKENGEKLKKTESELESIKKEMVKEKEEAQAKVKEIESLKNAVALLKKENNAYEEKISELQKRIDILNADLNETKLALIQKDLELRIIYDYVEAYGDLW